MLVLISITIFLAIPLTAYCEELPTLAAESDILTDGDDPDVTEGKEAMGKALGAVATLIIMVGLVLVALSVFNFIIATADQEAGRMAAAKISFGIGIALLFIVPIMKAIGLIK